MFRKIYTAAKKAALIGGILLSFFAFIEVIRAYQTLQAVHPVAGYAFVAALGALILWVGAKVLFFLFSRPKVLVPPPLPSLENATLGQAREYAQYLSLFARRLQANPLLLAPHKKRLDEGANSLSSAMSRSLDKDSLVQAVERMEKDSIEPCLASLDRQAELEVSQCVRDVMIGVTFSPWRSADLLVVSYRTVEMVLRVARVYASRPYIRDQFRIFVDIAKIVATVNYLNLGARLFESVFHTVPVLGKVGDDIAQGLGAAWFTSVAGHAAILRCRAFRGWNQAESQATLRANLANFLGDFHKIYAESIERRIVNLTKGQAEKLKKGVSGAFDSARTGLESFVSSTRDKVRDSFTFPRLTIHRK